MEMATFERLRPNFSDTDLVFLQGWGEPLLHPQFWEMVRQTKQAGAMAGFTTNATQLEGERLSRLIDSGVDVMAVSVAGVDPATHARFREGCDWRRIDESLVALKQLKQRQGVQRPHVHIAFSLLQSNSREIGGLAELSARWGAAQVVVSQVSWVGTEEMRHQSLMERPRQWPEVSTALEEARQAALRQGIGFQYFSPEPESLPATCTENVLKACYVSCHGDVSPCAFTSLATLRPDPIHYFEGLPYCVEPLVFGNLREQTLPAIWNSQQARAFREAFLKRQAMRDPGMAYLPEQCKHCNKLREAVRP